MILFLKVHFDNSILVLIETSLTTFFLQAWMTSRDINLTSLQKSEIKMSIVVLTIYGIAESTCASYHKRLRKQQSTLSR